MNFRRKIKSNIQERHNKYKILIGLELILVIIRCFFGVELTDETYYIGNANLLLEGGTPFVNMWMVQDGSMLMYSWLLGIYKYFVPDLAGSFLYMRLMSVVFRVVIIGIVHQVLQKHTSKDISMLCLLLLLPFSTELPTFSYNVLAFYMLLLAGILALDSLLVCRRAFCVWGIIGGLIALTIYSHPSTILNIFLFAGLALYSTYKDSSRSFWGYLFGGLFTTVVVSIWMTIRADGISNFIFGLQSMKTAAYFDMEKPGIYQQLEWLCTFAKKDILNLLVTFASVLLVSIMVNLLVGKKLTKQWCEVGCIITLTIWFVVTLWYNIFIIHVSQLILKLGEVIAIFALVGAICYWKKRIYKYCFLSIMLPAICFFIVNGFFSIQGPVNRLVIFVTCIVLCVLVFYLMLDTFNNRIARILVLIFAISVISTEFYFNYGYVYRDDAITRLSVQITEGVYKGLFTTTHRSKDLECMQQVLLEHVEPEEEVLFMDTFALGYLMTGASVCAPSSYEMITPVYNITDPECMYLYFDMMNIIPNQIIYARTERNTYMSIEMEDDYFPFNYFVKQNYELYDKVKICQDYEFFFYKLK